MEEVDCCALAPIEIDVGRIVAAILAALGIIPF
jgi:hypothetical protein